jgi:hypothetical protein
MINADRKYNTADLRIASSSGLLVGDAANALKMDDNATAVPASAIEKKKIKIKTKWTGKMLIFR